MFAISKEKLFNFVAAAITFYIAAAKFISFLETGLMLSLVKVIVALILVYIFIKRNSAFITKTSILDILITGLHSILPLFVESVDLSLINLEIGYVIISIGGFISILGLLNLWTNFGVLPAIRGITTNGIYKIIRHPIYLGYIISIFGWTLINVSNFNLALFGTYLILMKARISREESLLRSDISYGQYCKKVKFRVIPWVY